MSTDKVFIVMPAYNEAENIEEVIDSWHAVVEKINIYSKLIIFDDGSKDDTYNRMLKLQPKYPQLLPIKKENSGHGSTCLYAYNYAISNNADFIFQTDSDGQTNPKDFWNFYENRYNYDFIIGNRNNRQDGFGRKIIALVLKIVIFLIYKVWVKDPNCPFRLMHAKKTSYLMEKIPKNFFLANSLLSILIYQYKNKFQFKILWLPCEFKAREKGKSFINYINIFKIGIKSIKSFYNTKI